MLEAISTDRSTRAGIEKSGSRHSSKKRSSGTTNRRFKHRLSEVGGSKQSRTTGALRIVFTVATSNSVKEMEIGLGAQDSYGDEREGRYHAYLDFEVERVWVITVFVSQRFSQLCLNK